MARTDDISVSFFKSPFTGDESKIVKNTCVALYFNDERNKGGFMKGSGETVTSIIGMYLSFYALKTRQGGYAIFNPLDTSITTISGSKIADPANISKELDESVNFLETLSEVEKKLILQETQTHDIRGMMVGDKIVDGIAPLLQNRSTTTLNYVELQVPLKISDAQRSLKPIDDISAQTEIFDNRIEDLISAIADSFTKRLQKLRVELEKVESGHSQNVAKIVKEIEATKKGYVTEEAKEKKEAEKRAHDEVIDNLKGLYGRVQPNLVKDSEDLVKGVKDSLGKIQRLDETSTGFKESENILNEILDKVQIMQASVQTSLHIVSVERMKAEDRFVESDMDKDDVKIKYDRKREEEDGKLVELESAKDQRISSLQREITKMESAQTNYLNKRDKIRYQLSLEAPQLIGSFIDPAIIGSTVPSLKIKVPILAAFYRKGTTERVAVIPPIILPNRLDRLDPNNQFVSKDKTIGFDLISPHLRHIIEDNVEHYLNTNSEARERLKTDGSNLIDTEGVLDNLLRGTQLLVDRHALPKKKGEAVGQIAMNFRTVQ
ncbi:MAG: hypothetical protein ACTSYA_13050 [Candidatus Kariarchaeaceae archaeon]